MSPHLPQPITITDELLVAVHDRLGEILDRLPTRAPAEERDDGAVELREPQVHPSDGAKSGGEAGTPQPRPARKPVAGRKPVAPKPARRTR